MGHAFPATLLAAILLLGCTLFQDEVDKKLSECENSSKLMEYQLCALSVVAETAKTNPERAKKACDRVKSSVEQSVKSQVKGSEFYSIGAEFYAGSVYDLCISVANREFSSQQGPNS